MNKVARYRRGGHTAPFASPRPSRSDDMAKVLLIDDHPAVRHGLGLVLSSKSHVICGEAGSIGETLEQLESCAADIALLDLSLGEESGLDLVGALRQRGMAVLVYSMHEDSDRIRAALDAGAGGYVSKREMAEVVLVAVDHLLTGASFVSARAAQVLASSVTTEKRDVGALSEREHQILAMLGQGESNSQIAEALSISVRTVETYFDRIRVKVGVDNTRELRRYAINSGVR